MKVLRLGKIMSLSMLILDNEMAGIGLMEEGVTREDYRGAFCKLRILKH